jgi:predicted dehydrogenase
LATTLFDTREAVECARRAQVTLLVGPTLSYEPRYRMLRDIVDERRLGDLLSVQATSFTDWHRRRPRTAHDLDATTGNGLLLRQGAHQIDIVRLICGGDVRSVSGTLHGGEGGSERGFSAQLTFANGAQASAYYDGSGAAPETDEVVATFTGGGIRAYAGGLRVFSDGAHTDIAVMPTASVWDQALIEMDETLAGNAPIHDGEWALGTLATCLAIYQAAQSHSVVLTHLPHYQEKS